MTVYRLTYRIEVAHSGRSPHDNLGRAYRAAKVALGWLGRARHVRWAELEPIEIEVVSSGAGAPATGGEKTATGEVWPPSPHPAAHPLEEAADAG